MTELFNLIEFADTALKNNEDISPDIISKISDITSNNGYIGIAQINTKVGDLEYNSKKIAKYIKFANEVGLECVVFPELAIMGYPIDDTIDRHPIIVSENVKWLNGIAKLTQNTIALVGFIEPRSNCAGKKYYNSVAILQNGEIKGIVRKSLLPTYSEFNDFRYMEPSATAGVLPPELLCTGETVKQKAELYNGYGISICEDCWNDADFFQRTLYSKNPIEELSEGNPRLFINCSASPTRAKKEQLKHNMLSFISLKYKTPIIYVNQVGAIDNISFDGTSRVYDSEGKLIARAKSFEEQFMIVNPYKGIGKIYPLTKGLEKSLKEQKVFTLEYESDLERTYKTIIQGIRDYFNKCGFKRAVLGLSGGLDSTVCAVLMADAIGKENVFGVSMPSYITSKESKSDAEQLANNLGINFTEAPIKDMIDTTTNCLNKLFEDVESRWGKYFDYTTGKFTNKPANTHSSFTADNIQARSRAMFLWGMSNEFASCIPIATSDKSELYMGYATINGDMSGGFAPIADVPKTKLFAFARWLNSNRKEKNAIPESIILKKPGAELAIDPKTNKPLIAEDALMPYEFLDEIIWRIENKNESYNDLLNAEFIYEKHVKVSKEQKTEWLDKFYRRMSTALYKWSILPPSVIVEARSINKCDYRQPITSSGINYKGVNEKFITESLNLNSNV